jgi:hypothetical protein
VCSDRNVTMRIRQGFEAGLHVIHVLAQRQRYYTNKLIGIKVPSSVTFEYVLHKNFTYFGHYYLRQ